ncbi:MAG: succinate dehydrogenase / fumarate reductase cytochrome b subunit [Halieaceae bacterium]
MDDKRPVNLDLGAFSWPLPAIASITHRVTGVALFFGVGILIAMLDASLASEESFADLQAILAGPLAKLVVWGVVAALIYHSVAGVRHLIMDFGIGESLEGGLLGAQLTIGISVILIILAGIWIW